MIKLYNNETGDLIGEITESQLQFLIDNLEEESDDDVDYYINIPTIDSFVELGAEAGLIDVLKKGLGSNEDMEIRYEKE
ncbi:MAG: galactosyldiacylglycerol synthase [Ignavibacteriae bacterium]|nr:galactosyldiacylglycerol synthase [Ignavibacteriota bacterium]